MKRTTFFATIFGVVLAGAIVLTEVSLQQRPGQTPVGATDGEFNLFERGRDIAEAWGVWAVNAFKAGGKTVKEEVYRALADDSTANIRTLAGTLSVSLTYSDGEEFNGSYWLYVDGQLVAKKTPLQEGPSPLSAFEILLVPGEYAVELATKGVTEGAINFPLYFLESQIVKIDGGEIIEVKFLTYHVLESTWALSRTHTGPWRQWIEGLSKSVEDKITDYQASPVVQALYDVYNAFQQSPPLRPVVYINLPETYHGPREYDAYQVKLIVAWLVRYFWIWYPLPGHNQPENLNSMPDSIRVMFGPLSAEVQRHIKIIEKLDNIAVKLEQAEK